MGAVGFGLKHDGSGERTPWNTKSTKGREIHETPFAPFAFLRALRVPDPFALNAPEGLACFRAVGRALVIHRPDTAGSSLAPRWLKLPSPFTSREL